MSRLSQDYSNSYSYLTYPSEAVLNGLLRVENIFSDKITLNKTLPSGICYNSSDGIRELRVNDRMYRRTYNRNHLKIVFHYIKCRFIFRVKEIRKELNASKFAKVS